MPKDLRTYLDQLAATTPEDIFVVDREVDPKFELTGVVAKLEEEQRFPAVFFRNVKGSERASMVCDTLDRFHIVGKRDLYPSQLSGGQQQLVAVARAVIAHPKLILADEPTGNLHSSQGKEIMELFKRLNDEGTTIVQVTHSEANAAYGHRIIQLADGWVVSGGSTEATGKAV